MSDYLQGQSFLYMYDMLARWRLAIPSGLSGVPHALHLEHVLIAKAGQRSTSKSNVIALFLDPFDQFFVGDLYYSEIE